MTRRLLLLAALAAVALASVAWTSSQASFTTSSTTTVRASIGVITQWLSLYSSGSDPDGADRAGYAHQNNVATLPFVASGQDSGLAVDWGAYPDANTWYTFDRAFTFRTATAFPSGVTQVTVTVSVQQAAGENVQCTATMNTVGSSGGSTSLKLGPGVKRQVNVRLRTRSKWNPGDQFSPSIVLTVTSGSASSDSYTVPTVLTMQ